MEFSRNVLALKGYCFGIPINVLDKAFYDIINYIQQVMITTIVFDGDLLTYVPPDSTSNIPVKSYTQLIPRIYEWSINNNHNLEFIYCKKEKSIKKPLAGTEPYFDDHNTYLGPYWFLSEENTQILDEEMEITPLTWGCNIAVSMPNNTKFTEMGIRFMKWLKKGNINDICIYTIGQGKIVSEELENLKLLGNMVPNPNIILYNFERDTIP